MDMKFTTPVSLTQSQRLCTRLTEAFPPPIFDFRFSLFGLAGGQEGAAAEDNKGQQEDNDQVVGGVARPLACPDPLW